MKLKKAFIKYIILFLIVLLLFLPFFTRHYASDAYKIIEIGFKDYGVVALGNGRIFEYGVMLILSKINISYLSAYRVLIVLSSIIITVCIAIVYNVFAKESKSKWSKILLAICIFSIFFNYSLSEMCIFIECFNMCIGILAGILSSIAYNKKKYILAEIILIFGALNYQPAITLFVPFTLLMLFKQNTNLSLKEKIISVIKIMAMYYLSLAVCYIVVKVISLNGYSIDGRLSNVNILNNISYILYNTKNYGILMLAMVCVYYVIYGSSNENITKKIVIDTIILLLVCLISTTSLTFLNNSILSPRMSISILGFAGILGIYLYNNSEFVANRVFVLAIILLTINIAGFMLCIYLNIWQTKQNDIIFEKIRNEVLQNADISNVRYYAFYRDENNDYYNKYTGILGSLYSPLYSNWSSKYVLKNLTGKYLEEVAPNRDTYEKYFKGRDYKEFNTNQIVIEGETINICIY